VLDHVSVHVIALLNGGGLGVTLEAIAATQLAVVAAIAGKRIAARSRQPRDGLSGEDVEQQVRERLGYAPRRASAPS
jgi:membrane protein implicated in regulation of membrane protease activity